MLALDDDQWDALKGNSGQSGRCVAEYVRKLRNRTLTKNELDLLYQEMCHQYTTSWAGLAAVPHVLEVASTRAYPENLNLLSLAAHTYACAAPARNESLPECVREPLHNARQVGFALARDGLVLNECTDTDIQYLLAAIAGFSDQYGLYSVLENLDCGIECPSCGHEIYPLDSNNCLPG